MDNAYNNNTYIDFLAAELGFNKSNIKYSILPIYLI